MPRSKKKKVLNQQNDSDNNWLINNYYFNKIFIIRHWLENEEKDKQSRQQQEEKHQDEQPSSIIQQFTKNYFQNLDINSKNFETETKNDNKKHKKNKMKKKNKCNKRSNNNTATTATTPVSDSKNNTVQEEVPCTASTTTKSNSDSKSNRQVSFGTVCISEYKRGLGVDTIPNDGTNYPLGLIDIKPIRSYTLGNVNDVEINRQDKLHQRYNDCIASGGSSKKNKKKSSKEALDKDVVQLPKIEDDNIIIFETRQWDYRKTNHRNPLFKPLVEQERKDIFIRDLLPTDIKDSNHTTTAITTTTTSKPSNSSKQQAHRKSKNHKSKVHNNNNHNTRATTTTTTEILPFTLHEIDTIQNSITSIHNERSFHNQSRGCNCHILSKTACKKKVKHYSLHKLIDELQKRHLLPEENEQSLSREEMEIILLKELENNELYSCCELNDHCYCKSHGIECHLLFCSCCTITKGNKHLSDMNKDVKEDDIYRKMCGNKYGIYTVKENDIQKHWDNVLCLPTSTTATSG